MPKVGLEDLGLSDLSVAVATNDTYTDDKISVAPLVAGVLKGVHKEEVKRWVAEHILAAEAVLLPVSVAQVSGIKDSTESEADKMVIINKPFNEDLVDKVLEISGYNLLDKINATDAKSDKSTSLLHTLTPVATDKTERSQEQPAFQENGNNSNASVATEGSAVGSAPSPAPPTSLSPAMESPQGDGAALRQPINANPGPGPDPAAARHSSSLP